MQRERGTDDPLSSCVMRGQGAGVLKSQPCNHVSCVYQIVAVEAAVPTLRGDQATHHILRRHVSKYRGHQASHPGLTHDLLTWRVHPVPQRRALTLAEAAERLHVCPQRISQMLRAGVLTGPDVGPGRAPKGAPRVWESAIAEESKRRATAKQQMAKGTRSTGNVSKPDDARAPRHPVQEEVLVLKVQLDAARDALRKERRANQRLVRLLAEAVAEIQEAQTQADRVDAMADAYSEVLTQLGTPDDTSTLG